MLTDPETSHTITFDIDDEAFIELEKWAAAEGRSYLMHARHLLLDILGQYKPYTPKKKTSAAANQGAGKRSRRAGKTTALGGLS